MSLVVLTGVLALKRTDACTRSESERKPGERVYVIHVTGSQPSFRLEAVWIMKQLRTASKSVRIRDDNCLHKTFQFRF